ncbi:hypothetical protein COCCADRAFT_109960 [Bipolaris zeicola 26-R-13]|uniref:Uncharacterized protein n=1 Tax=Cochliobolus carbonum (strain 26-R-13) TaxID=930089 RepID=W6XZH5_COCC2|nr:uncharacterized protein COCCADRAFT_109960 [Bipolaris zeicola 26-R-13]EUC28134.1 hypothetical protein COCCADRAFT_109960 [Bipolaris zeicola 26-R-13]
MRHEQRVPDHQLHKLRALEPQPHISTATRTLPAQPQSSVPQYKSTADFTVHESHYHAVNNAGLGWLWLGLRDLERRVRPCNPTRKNAPMQCYYTLGDWPGQ